MDGIGRNSFELTDDTPVFVISVAAQLAGLHAQTLRQYDRLGLVSPGRTPGGGRRYSARDIEQIRQIQRLSQEEGINLAGVKRILELQNMVAALRAQLRELQRELEDVSAIAQQRAAATARIAAFRRELVPMSEHARQTALAVWRPRRWRADRAGLVERIDYSEQGENSIL
jgi:MerR family transcriptional regulator, heat shock protein HspR